MQFIHPHSSFQKLCFITQSSGKPNSSLCRVVYMLLLSLFNEDNLNVHMSTTVSDVVEMLVQFASKILTPHRMR